MPVRTSASFPKPKRERCACLLTTSGCSTTRKSPYCTSPRSVSREPRSSPTPIWWRGTGHGVTSRGDRRSRSRTTASLSPPRGAREHARQEPPRIRRRASTPPRERRFVRQATRGQGQLASVEGLQDRERQAGRDRL